MSIWETLGIAPTDDLAAVRRAYAAKTKDCHPEEDQEGFRRLHEAYQSALALARGMRRRTEEETQNFTRRPEEERSEAASAEKSPEQPPDFRSLLKGGHTAAAEAPPLAAGPPEEEPLDISAHISKGLEEGREQEAHWRGRRIERMLAELDRLATQWETPDFYLRWRRCLGSIPFQAVMLEEAFLKGLEVLLTMRDRLPEGACLALYLAYGFSEDSFWGGHPLLGGLYDRLSPRIPRQARREADPQRETERKALFRLPNLWKVGCWFAALAALTMLPGILEPEVGRTLRVLFSLGGPLGLWGFAVLLRRARCLRWQEHLPLCPVGRGYRWAPILLTLAEVLLLYATAGGAAQDAAADTAALVAIWALLLLLCAVLPAMVLVLCNDFILLGDAALVFSVPAAPYRVVPWDRVVAVRQRHVEKGRQLLFLLADGTSVRLLAERYEGGQELVEAARRRGLLFSVSDE